MENRLARIAFTGLLFMSFLLIEAEADKEFIKPKKKVVAKLKPEDCCYESLPVMKTAGRVLQELGIMQELTTVLVEGVIDNDKKAPLKTAKQEQLQELNKRQEALHRMLLALEKELHLFNDYADSLVRCT